MDQALRTADFTGLSKLEKLAFTMMVQKEKIAEAQGKKFFEEQIQKIRQQNKTVKERLDSIDELSEDTKAHYYSSWLYGAIHILCAFSWINSAEEIALTLKIEKQTSAECIRFLIEHGLIEMKNRKLSIGKRQIHLGHESKQIFSHHTNWRLKAIEKFSAQRTDGLHFSSLIGISERDSDQVQEILLKAVGDINALVKRSGEDAAYVINMDFFQL